MRPSWCAVFEENFIWHFTRATSTVPSRDEWRWVRSRTGQVPAGKGNDCNRTRRLKCQLKKGITCGLCGGGAAPPRQRSGCLSPASQISSCSSGSCAGAARGEGARDSRQSNAACNKTSHPCSGCSVSCECDTGGRHILGLRRFGLLEGGLRQIRGNGGAREGARVRAYLRRGGVGGAGGGAQPRAHPRTHAEPPHPAHPVPGSRESRSNQARAKGKSVDGSPRDPAGRWPPCHPLATRFAQLPFVASRTSGASPVRRRPRG